VSAVDEKEVEGLSNENEIRGWREGVCVGTNF
jgi:hypothetical protein